MEPTVGLTTEERIRKSDTKKVWLFLPWILRNGIPVIVSNPEN